MISFDLKCKRGIDLKSMTQLRYHHVPTKEHRQDLHPSWVQFPPVSFFGIKKWWFSIGTILRKRKTILFF